MLDAVLLKNPEKQRVKIKLLCLRTKSFLGTENHNRVDIILAVFGRWSHGYFITVPSFCKMVVKCIQFLIICWRCFVQIPLIQHPSACPPPVLTLSSYHLSEFRLGIITPFREDVCIIINWVVNLIDHRPVN